MYFVWITDNYRVNLDAIFSLEKKVIDNYLAYNNWLEKYNEKMTYYEENGIDWWLENNEDPIHIDKNFDFSNIESEELKKYKDWEEFKYDYIMKYEMGNQQPQRYTYEYWIILSTGIKVQLAQDKFEYINETINNYY